MQKNEAHGVVPDSAVSARREHDNADSTSTYQLQAPDPKARVRSEADLREIIDSMDVTGEDWSGESRLSPGSIDICTFDGEWADLVH